MKSLKYIEWGIAFKTLEGQNESGDHHLITFFEDGALIAVADGLGHGPEAAEAARAAIKILENHPDEPVISLANRCHRGLIGTRGAALTLVSLRGLGRENERIASLDWLAVGNVNGFLFRKGENTVPRVEGVLLNAGIVGYQIPSLKATSVSLMHNDLLILATDGIQGVFVEDLRRKYSRFQPQEIADGILANHHKPTDDALVCVVRYMEKSNE